MSHRPALVSGLTVADYLLWNWSLTNGHDVLALIAGLTLLPLGAVCVWLLTLSLARVLAHSTRRRAPVTARRHGASAQGQPQQTREAGIASASRPQEEPAAASTGTSSASPSRKLAA